MYWYKYVVIFLLICFSLLAKSQNSRIGIEFSNNITSFPVTTYPQLFYTQFHPGLDFCKSWRINKNEKNQIWCSGNLGGYYHRFIQTAVRIYPSVEYNRMLGKGFLFHIGLGVGYSLAFENMETFELQDDGTYKMKTMVARSQYLAMFDWGGSYSIKKDALEGMKISLKFKTFIQGPFVSGYVPMLPVNSVMLGVSIPVKSK